MWWQEDEIVKYIKDWPYDYDVAKTLLLSWVQDKSPGQLQLLIPIELVKPTGLMGITAVCKALIEQLPDKDPIDYDKIFQENINGDKGPNTPSHG